MCPIFIVYVAWKWLLAQESLALWLEGFALVAIFVLELKEYSGQGRERKEQHEQTLVQMEIMRNQAIATEKAANAANKSAEMFIAKECARLEIIAGEVPVIPNAPIRISCHINNIGPTLAFIEESALALVEAGSEIEVDYARCDRMPFVGNVRPNDRTQGEVLVALKPETIITEGTVLEIREKKSFIHCYGYVKYRDVFQRRRRVRLHLRWFMLFGGIMEGQRTEWWEVVGTSEENSDTEDIA